MRKKEEKFRQLIDENKECILGICRHYSANNDDLQDIYQEVLVNIWKSLHTFKGEAKISTWIYRVAVNTAISFVNKEIRRRQLFIDVQHNEMQNFMELDEGKAKNQEVLFEALNAQINLLSVIDKIIITLVLESVPLKEIAQVIGITEPNVRVKVHRIKTELKEALQHVSF